MSAPVIPGYTFVDHLGSGGFADVFLYEQEWPRQRVAVKIVRPDVPLNEREKSLFTAEANSMARLADHPYIVSVITAGVTQDGRPYLVMRYCPPPDLGVRVRSNPLSVADALATGIKLASAIETAHRSGILHRDIKPSNVLITSYHEPALTDFGIAGHIHDVASDSEVRISYPWSPPEMLDGRSNGSVTSDVYSLGATIWHLLVGRSPFSIPSGDNSTRALSARILHAAAPATQRAEVPGALDRLLQQCLAKQPAHRPQSALELARALQRIEAGVGLQRTPVAVEGDRPDESVALPVVEEDIHDRTVLKPVTVVSASGPRKVAPTGEFATDEHKPVSNAVWAGLGVAVLAVLVGALVLGGGSRDPDKVDTPPTVAPSTPGAVIPEAEGPPAPPVVTATTTSQGVKFTWRPDEPVADAHSWLVRQGDDEQRLTRTSLTVKPATEGRTCLAVALLQSGQQSEWTTECA